jgi:hypothetical protein
MQVSIYQKLTQHPLMFFLFFCLFFLSFRYISAEWLVTQEVFFAHHSERLTLERVEKLWENKEKYAWVGYIVVLPLYYLIKFVLVAACLQIGLILGRYKVSFGKVFKVAILAECVFILPTLIQLYWFSFFVDSYTIADLHKFDYFSLMAFFKDLEIERYLQYPLYLVNIFEVLYILVLAYGLHEAIEKEYDTSLRLVLATYLPSLCLWALFVMFLSISA